MKALRQDTDKLVVRNKKPPSGSSSPIATFNLPSGLKLPPVVAGRPRNVFADRI